MSKSKSEEAEDWVNKYKDHAVDSLYFALGADLNCKVIRDSFHAGWQACATAIVKAMMDKSYTQSMGGGARREVVQLSDLIKWVEGEENISVADKARELGVEIVPDAEDSAEIVLLSGKRVEGEQ